jgi:IS605 OrfB family transposase
MSCDSRNSVIPSPSPPLYTLHLYGTFHVMQRTMRLELHPTPEQAHTITATLAQCTDAFNWVCAYGWEHDEKNSVRLHHATYYLVKKVCPGLVSDLVIQARVKATEALKSAFTQRKAQHKVSCLRSQRCAVRYNVHTCILQWEGAGVRLSTVHGRLSIPSGGTIVHEDLPNIRCRVRARRGAGQRRLHAWSFAQWRQFVVYKAEEAGLDVVAIDPRHTSQTCSHCGFKDRANRRSQALFPCRHCGYTLHADLNAANNIAAKYRASRGISSAGAPLSTGVSSPFPREERDKLPL